VRFWSGDRYNTISGYRWVPARAGGAVTRKNFIWATKRENHLENVRIVKLIIKSKRRNQ
jgi:hypothetical protein